MTRSTRVRATAFAKVTLALRVLGRRDDGYHELDALMVSLSEPYDVLWIERATRTSLEVGGPFAADVPADATNLAWRAAAACGAAVAMRLHKGIPPAVGLGGGSADAAAVLVALAGDARVGAALGADVPFCMVGGAARVRGIGEVIEPVPLPSPSIVIAAPPFGCATAAVYRAWDQLGGPHTPPNDLESAAHRVEPRLVGFKRAVENAAGTPAILAGSGSSYAVVFADAADAAVAQHRIRAAVDASVWTARTVDRGVFL
jgi:4-diphosphocytidyl-2-C-methyl-D-erythritol kinase